jgi:hypothetical protein
MDPFRRCIGAAVFVLGFCHPVLAAPDDHHRCPAADPNETMVIAALGDDVKQDKARLDTLAAAIVKQRRSVCILAFVDAMDAGHSRMLALRRAMWVRESLIGKGVESGVIAMELRPLAADQDKATLRQVQVLLLR